MKSILSMRRSFTFTGMILFSYMVQAQYITKYPEIPRIDVHSHVANNYPAIRSYLALRNRMLAENKTDIAMWINLSSREGGENAIDTITEISQNRIMTCISDFTPQKGLTHRAKDIRTYIEKGFVGYKIWYGTLLQQYHYGRLKEGDKEIKYPYIDDPHNDDVFKAMEKEGMVLASVHIADPNGPIDNRVPCSDCFCPDPVVFWRSITGLERVLQRHPGLVTVAAHGAWLLIQDAQIDFLRYLFKTYSNFYVDLAATDFFYLPTRENLRDILIEYSDRFLFATDIQKIDSSQIPERISGYARIFEMLETDNTVKVGPSLFKGLNLPEEALENIYYKNALKVYPSLSERMRRLGYKI